MISARRKVRIDSGISRSKDHAYWYDYVGTEGKILCCRDVFVVANPAEGGD